LLVHTRLIARCWYCRPLNRHTLPTTPTFHQIAPICNPRLLFFSPSQCHLTFICIIQITNYYLSHQLNSQPKSLPTNPSKLFTNNLTFRNLFFFSFFFFFPPNRKKTHTHNPNPNSTHNDRQHIWSQCSCF
jgi:hypothetical protein